MIFCKELAFLHIPKTAGMSLTKYLLGVLPRPVYYSYPNANADSNDDGIVHVPGVRHETLREAADVVHRFGFNINDFPVVLVAVRNPYAMEVSRYSYLQAGHSWDRGHNQTLALTADFTTFTIYSRFHSGPSRCLEDYLLLDGRQPSNLRIVKAENLQQEVADVLDKLGIPSRGEIPWENKSAHDDFLLYYAKEAEEAVYNRYRWLFDQGFYNRLTFDDSAGKNTAAHVLPLSGPIEKIGSCVGCWPDLWLARLFSFEVQLDQPVTRVTIDGLLPEYPSVPRQLTLRANEFFKRFSYSDGGVFSSVLACDIPRNAILRISVTTSPLWCPATNGESKDKRKLAFKLQRISIE